MSESPSLDDLIGDRARDEKGRFMAPPAVTAQAEAPKAPEPKAPEPKAPEAPKEPVKAPEPAAPAAPVAPTPAPAPPTESAEAAAYKKAMREEREKRQKLERELQELRQPPKPVDPYDTPAVANQLREEMRQNRLLWSEDMAREKYKDFEEVIVHFNEAVEKNPALATQMVNARNPAEFAYRQGILHRELSTVDGDPIAYRSKLEKDVESRVEARLRAEFEAKYGKTETPVPTSLNSDPSPGQPAPVYAGPPPLDTILRNGSNARR